MTKKQIDLSLLHRLRGALLKFKDITAEDGTVLTIDGDLEVGKDVLTYTEDGEAVPAADGDYRTGDVVVTVEGGKITKIEAQEKEPEPPAENKMKAVAHAFEQTYDEKTKKVYDAIVALGFDIYGWIVEIAETYAVYAVWNEGNGDVYTRFDIAWNGDEVTVSNPTEVKPAFVAKDDKNPMDSGGSAEEETLRQENTRLKAEVQRLSDKLKESVEQPVGKDNPEQPKGNPFLAAIHGRK
jgi:hypothetical protein